MSTRKHMDHAEYQRQLKRKSVAQLRYIIKDALEAIHALQRGENEGYYADEIHYAAAELRNRGY